MEPGRGKAAAQQPPTLEEITHRACAFYGFTRQQGKAIFEAVLEASIVEEERCFAAMKQYLWGKVPPELVDGLAEALDAAPEERAAA